MALGIRDGRAQAAAPADDLQRAIMLECPPDILWVHFRHAAAARGELCGLRAIGVGITRDVADRAASLAVFAAFIRRWGVL